MHNSYISIFLTIQRSKSNNTDGLLAQRKYLYSRSNKEKDLIAKAKLSKEVKALTPDIKVLRSQIKSLDYIRKRSSKYREYNKQLEQKRNLDKQRA